MVISAAMWLQHNTVNGAPRQCWRWQSIYAAARRRSKLVVVCDMVVHLPVRATPARPGRHAVTARRVDAFISRLRGRPSAPAADRPETPNDTKDAWHDDADASSSSPYFRLINYWRRQNAAAEPSRCYRPALKTDWLCISTRFELPAILFCSHIRGAYAAYGNRCRFCSRCYQCTKRYYKNISRSLKAVPVW